MSQSNVTVVYIQTKNITGHDISIDNFSIVGRKDQNIARSIHEAILIRFNDPSLNRNRGKYQLPNIMDERLDFLHNRIDILSWRQAFAWHQARLSQVWENVKLHAFIYTWSVLENTQ